MVEAFIKDKQILKIGKSLAITLPEKMMNNMGWVAGNTVRVFWDTNRNTIVLQKIV